MTKQNKIAVAGVAVIALWILVVLGGEVKRQYRIYKRESYCFNKYGSWEIKDLFAGYDKPEILETHCLTTVLRTRLDDMYSIVESNEAIDETLRGQIMSEAAYAKDERFLPHIISYQKYLMSHKDSSSLTQISNFGGEKALKALSELEKYVRENNLSDQHLKDIARLRKTVFARRKRVTFWGHVLFYY